MTHVTIFWGDCMSLNDLNSAQDVWKINYSISTTITVIFTPSMNSMTILVVTKMIPLIILMMIILMLIIIVMISMIIIMVIIVIDIFTMIMMMITMMI